MIITNTFVWSKVLTFYALVSVSTFSFSTDPYKNLLQAQYQNLRENLRILFWEGEMLMLLMQITRKEQKNWWR